MRPVVLALNNCYVPGFKGGGPVRSLSGMVERLADQFDIRVVTQDRDDGDHVPYPDVQPDRWTPVGAGQVLYLPAVKGFWASLVRTLRNEPCDLLYVNSFFSFRFGIAPALLRRLGLSRRPPLLVAPRGQLAPGALGLKRGKKRAYLEFAKSTGLYRGAVWHATSDEEVEEIRRWFGAQSSIHLAGNLSPLVDSDLVRQKPKESGRLRLAFLSRITRKKNLDLSVRLLEMLGGPVELDIYGPQEEPQYWREVEALVRELPSDVQVAYCGTVAPEHVCEVLGDYDAFLFPTLGENFGHVILEALLAGCPPVISDRTPWSAIAELGCGFVAPLDRVDRFVEALRALRSMDETEHAGMRLRARGHARSYLRADQNVESTRSMFQSALAR